MKNVIAALVLLTAFCANTHAQNRIESTYQLKKAVYSGDASQLPQLVKTLDFMSGGNDYHYAIVSVPEINLTNMPTITVWVYTTRTVALPGWMPADYNLLRNDAVVLTNGICYLRWKVDSVEYFTQFKIVVTYEDVPTSAPASFKILSTSVSNQVVTLDWATMSGQRYGLEASSNLVVWAPLVSNLVATGSNFTFSTNVVDPSKFYRAYRAP